MFQFFCMWKNIAFIHEDDCEEESIYREVKRIKRQYKWQILNYYLIIINLFINPVPMTYPNVTCTYFIYDLMHHIIWNYFYCVNACLQFYQNLLFDFHEIITLILIYKALINLFNEY